MVMRMQSLTLTAWRVWWSSSSLLLIVRLDNLLTNHVESSMRLYRDKNTNLSEEVTCILMTPIGMGDTWIPFCLNTGNTCISVRYMYVQTEKFYNYSLSQVIDSITVWWFLIKILGRKSKISLLKYHLYYPEKLILFP